MRNLSIYETIEGVLVKGCEAKNISISEVVNSLDFVKNNNSIFRSIGNIKNTIISNSFDGLEDDNEFIIIYNEVEVDFNKVIKSEGLSRVWDNKVDVVVIITVMPNSVGRGINIGMNNSSIEESNELFEAVELFVYNNITFPNYKDLLSQISEKLKTIKRRYAC